MFLAIKAVNKDMKAKESFVDSHWKPFLATNSLLTPSDFICLTIFVNVRSSTLF